MIRTKICDMNDLARDDFKAIEAMYNSHFGPNWAQVPVRRWEYVAAILFSGILDNPGKALEAGCGHSVFSRMLAKCGNDVDAFDYRLGRPNYPEFRYHDMSMIDIKFVDNTFDYVFAISSIEHINAGNFKIFGLDFDTGDNLAAAELVRVLKPEGILVITTDFAQKYYPPPGLWKSASHRIYNWEQFCQRLVLPFSLEFYEDIDVGSFDFENIVNVEPKGYAYTEFIATLKKVGQ